MTEAISNVQINQLDQRQKLSKSYSYSLENDCLLKKHDFNTQSTFIYIN